jgi:hypothetical protein
MVPRTASPGPRHLAGTGSMPTRLQLQAVGQLRRTARRERRLPPERSLPSRTRG